MDGRAISRNPARRRGRTPRTPRLPPQPLKRPGLHRTSNLLALSRGSEGILYFQFRASRGSSEKYHGSVVSHDGRDDTRVFRDVRDTGGMLKTLQPLLGSLARPEIAIIQDYQNLWALEASQPPAIRSLRPKAMPFDGSARVPWLMRFPQSWEIKTRQVLDAPIELRDVLPTLCECAGIPVPDSIEGSSVLPLLRDAPAAANWREYLHGEHIYTAAESNQWLTDGREK